MKNIFFLVLVTTSAATAQQMSISGQLIDSAGAPLPAATVMLLNPNDSSLVNFTVADPNGLFAFKSLGGRNYLLKITFMGYRTFEKLVAYNREKAAVNLGTIILEPASRELAAVEIVAERPPVTVKKDTIEFNASSFRTKENAVVEDLLKKLPGIEIDNEGNVTAQGEQVKSVMVDGKKFFGNDPKVATRNLPADAIDKVQVFDKLSDQAAFTGVDDGEREKTINLELKEEKRNAMFGKMMAGAGSEDRLEARASLNKFSKGSQLSFLGMGNNVNQSGFGMDDYVNFTGGARQMMGGGGMRIMVNSENSQGMPLNFGNRANGLMTTYAGGVNVNEELSKKTEVNGSYFYNYLNHNLDQTTYRENYLPNGNFLFNEEKKENNSNWNHKANATIDHKIDSSNTLRFTSTFSANETKSEQSSASENIAPDGTLANENERWYTAAGSRTNFNGNMLYRHRFPKIGRSISANVLLGINQNESGGTLNATNDYYGENERREILQQSNDQSTDYVSYGTTVSYTEPLGRRKYLEANYNFRGNKNDVEKEVYNINNGEATFNADLSNRYNSYYQYHRGGINFRIAQSDYNFVAGVSFQETFLHGNLELPDATIDKNFSNVLPALRFQYDFSQSKHLRFNYETSVTEPDIQQLQPVVDNSDPLNIYVGNPDLRPSYVQSWRVNFTTFNPVNFVNLFAFADVDYTRDPIVNAQSIDENFVRTITPVNVSSNLSINTHVNAGIPIRKLGSRFNVTGRFRHVDNIAIINDRENDVIQQVIGGSLRYTYEYKDIFDISLNARIDHQVSRYDIDEPDQTFLNEEYTAEGNLQFLRNYTLSANVEYLVYKNRSAHYEQAIPLLNLSVSRFFLKNKSGELKFAVNNLLDRALGVDQTANLNYVERITTNSLGRYFMVSFTYALNKLLDPMSMRRGGSAIRRIGG